MTAKAAVTLFIPCDPMPSPRPRARVNGRFANIYMPPEYVDWKDEVAAAIRATLSPVDPEQFEAPVTVTAEFVCLSPKTTKLPFPKPDLDNYLKSLLDAATESATLWKDDCQVNATKASKRWAAEGERTGIKLKITYAN